MRDERDTDAVLPFLWNVRAVEDWHERGDALVIQLEPCGHELERSAGVEWPIPKAA